MIEKALTIYTLKQLYEYTVDASDVYCLTGELEDVSDDAGTHGSSKGRSALRRRATTEDSPPDMIRSLLTTMRAGSDPRAMLLANSSRKMESAASEISAFDYLTATVNYQGLVAVMQQMLGEDIKFIEDKLTEEFKALSTDGKLDWVSFGELMRTLAGEEEIHPNLTRALTLQTSRPSCPEDEFHIKTILQGDGEFSAKQWTMLYCGGSQPVVDQLKAYRDKFGIGLSVEKFDW